MKKIIITFFLMIFIIFTFGITTSNAWIPYYYYNSDSKIKYEKEAVIGEKTTSGGMLEFFKSTSKSYLTGISTTVRDKNLYLLCRERHWALYGDGKYVDADGLEDDSLWTKENSSTTFPGVDTNGNGKLEKDELEKDNEGNVIGYAAAYILAAEEDKNGNEYIKNDEIYNGRVDETDERQYAWYLLKEWQSGDSKNDLFEIAKDYQTYKMSELDFNVTTKDNTNTQITEDNIKYGPINVTYSYEERKRFKQEIR